MNQKEEPKECEYQGGAQEVWAVQHGRSREHQEMPKVQQNTGKMKKGGNARETKPFLLLHFVPSRGLGSAFFSCPNTQLKPTSQ